MKKFIKWFFIVLVSMSVIGVVVSLVFTSSEDMAEYNFKTTSEKFSQAESEYDVADVFGELNALAREDTTLQPKIDSLYELRPQFIEEAIQRGINNNQHVAWYRARDYIKAALKSPSSAKFASYSESRVAYNYDDNVYHVTMWVESQNSFGAMLRKDFTVQLKRTVDINNNESWSLVALKE